MRDEARVILRGAVVGALVGAAGAWAYRRFGPMAGSSSAGLGRTKGIDRGQLAKLALSVLGVIRQVSELR